MAPPSHSSQPYEYLDALLTAIPNDSIPPEMANPSQSAHRPYPKFIDTALRLASGGPARPDDAAHIRDAWPEIQASVQRALHALRPSSTATAGTSSQKRNHSPSIPDTNSKKPKFEDGGEDDEDDDDDVPQLTLHALSATAPVRHKIDITQHVRTLRLAHGTTGAHIARCSRTSLTRVFLLPTRARSSGALQWTALLLAGDKPAAPPPRGAAKAAAGTAAAAVRFELACSIPDSSKPGALPRMTVHTPTSASQTTSTRDALLALLTSTISALPIPLTTVERGAQLAGITAFRGVRETALWFFDGAGILADGRPAEFWAVADLARGEAGVRVRTATGRTCSVVLMRRGEHDGDEDGGAEEGEEEEEEGEETEFQMIDGKERERILEWVRRNRGAFGIAGVRGGDGAPAPRGAVVKGKENGKAGVGAGQEGEEGVDARGGGGEGDSDSDSDFEESGESDGGSPSSGSGSGSDAGSDAGSEHEARSGSGSGSGGEGDGSGRDSDDDDDDDDDVKELEPKHHPLLRAGGLPKMSRAAMDAAVGLVVGDLVGEARGNDEEDDELED